MRNKEQLIAGFKDRLGSANITTSKAQTEALFNAMTDFFKGIERERDETLADAQIEPYDRRRMEEDAITERLSRGERK